MAESRHADIAIKVVPGARRSEIGGIMDDGITWKFKIAAPAMDGKANSALIEFVAAHFRLAKNCVILLSGEKSRQKRIRLMGISQDKANELLAAAG